MGDGVLCAEAVDRQTVAITMGLDGMDGVCVCVCVHTSDWSRTGLRAVSSGKRMLARPGERDTETETERVETI